MAKKPRLTENTKKRRVEIAEENVEFDNKIWGETIFWMNSGLKQDQRDSFE
jgi:hypothetical protein